MTELVRWLRGICYDSVVSSIDPRSVNRFDNWLLKNIDLAVDEPLSVAIDLLYLGKNLEKGLIERVIPENIISCLLNNYIIEGDNKYYKARNMRLNFSEGIAIFSDPPSSFQKIYFGEESIYFGRQHPLGDLRGLIALDICCGPGYQSLQLAKTYSQVYGVDVNPKAVALASLNSRLNSFGNITTFESSSLQNYTPTMQFDYICMNPPLVPGPPDHMLPLVAEGGEDGLKLTYLAIRKLEQLMKPGGTFRSLGLTYIKDGSPKPFVELEKLAKEYSLSITWSTISEFSIGPGSYNFNRMVNSFFEEEGKNKDQIENSYRNYLQKNKINSMCSYYLDIKKINYPKFSYHDFSTFHTNNCWSYYA